MGFGTSVPISNNHRLVDADGDNDATKSLQWRIRRSVGAGDSPSCVAGADSGLDTAAFIGADWVRVFPFRRRRVAFQWHGRGTRPITGRHDDAQRVKWRAKKKTRAEPSREKGGAVAAYAVGFTSRRSTRCQLTSTTKRRDATARLTGCFSLRPSTRCDSSYSLLGLDLLRFFFAFSFPTAAAAAAAASTSADADTATTYSPTPSIHVLFIRPFFASSFGYPRLRLLLLLVVVVCWRSLGRLPTQHLNGKTTSQRRLARPPAARHRPGLKKSHRRPHFSHQNSHIVSRFGPRPLILSPRRLCQRPHCFIRSLARSNFRLLQLAQCRFSFSCVVFFSPPARVGNSLEFSRTHSTRIEWGSFRGEF